MQQFPAPRSDDKSLPTPCDCGVRRQQLKGWTDWIPSFTFWIVKIQLLPQTNPIPAGLPLAEDRVEQKWMRSPLWTSTLIPTCCDYSGSKPFSILQSQMSKSLSFESKRALWSHSAKKVLPFSPAASGLLVPRVLTHNRYCLWRCITECLLTAILLSDFPRTLLASSY